MSDDQDLAAYRERLAGLSAGELLDVAVATEAARRAAAHVAYSYASLLQRLDKAWSGLAWNLVAGLLLAIAILAAQWITR